MSEFFFGDFSEQETENLFGNDKQGVKFPWTTDDCLNTTIEFGFDVPPLKASSAIAGVSYTNYSSCNDSSSQKESTSSVLNSPPGSSKSSSNENGKKNQSSPPHHRHHSDRKSKKKRPPNYYKQEYQQMLEPSTLQYQSNHNQNDEHKTNTNDPRYISCDQWVDSTIQHQHDDKQLTNDEDEQSNNDDQTTTDTDNENDGLQTIPINNISLTNTNESSVYSTSVASGASIETLKPSENPTNLSTSAKSKVSLWADLFRSEQTNQSPSTASTPTVSIKSNTKSSNQTIHQNGRNSSSHHYQPKTNYNIYNSNGEDSKSLEDYFSKCEVRPSAIAIIPRGLTNHSNYCYVNATLQALLACPALFNVMKHIPLNSDDDQDRVPCIRAIHHFINQFEKMDRNKSNSNSREIIFGSPFDATKVLEEIARLRNLPVEIIRSKQEDAHELLCQLLNQIHEEICQILYSQNQNKPDKTASTSDSTTQDSLINSDEDSNDWFKVGKRNRTHVYRTSEIQKSLISDIFAGKISSTVHSVGNQRSIVTEPFFTLSLDIKDPNVTSIDEALQLYCQPSNLSDFVDNKNRSNATSKTMLFDHLPPILIIHLKSFIYDAKSGTRKLFRKINYSVNLVLPSDILTKQAQNQEHGRYKLFAVEYHLGDEAIKGHYLTDVFHPRLQGWLRHDDAKITIIGSNQVTNPSQEKLTPYLLFYRRDE